MDDYQAFLERKKIRVVPCGFESAEINPKLFAWQTAIVKWALQRGKAAIFADCGLGKSGMQLQWAKEVCDHTGGDVLVLAPLSVTKQTQREGVKFGIDSTVCRTMNDVHKGINITNYEMLEHFDASHFVGVVMDESSCIKDKTSKTRNYIQKAFQDTPYKLCCTATPAPNDYMELGTHAEFLGAMKQTEMLATFFVHDGGDTAHWRLKSHAKQDFFAWIANWACCMNKPGDLGYSNEGFDLPPLRMHEIVVPSGKMERDGQFCFISPEVQTLTERRDARRESMVRRVEKAAEIANGTDEPVLVWCDLNAESEALTKAIPDAVEVRGSMTLDEKESRTEAFTEQRARVIVSKASITGWGVNWQFCHKMIFVGLSDCYDETTEVLTIDGWKTFGNVTLDDSIATISQDNQAMEWQKPERIVWEDYDGEMVSLKERHGYDLLVTPNHKLFVSRPTDRYPTSDGTWHHEYADDVCTDYKKQFRRMLVAPKSFVNCECESVIHIPIYDELRISSRSRIVKEIASDSFCKLAGWYITEGYCRPYGSVEFGRIAITQAFQHDEYRKEIIGLLSDAGLHVNSKTKDITAYSANLAKFLIDEFGGSSGEKRIPKWLKNYPKEQLIILRDTLIKGDGNIQRGQSKSFRTSSKQLADDFQEICIKTGVKATLVVRYGVNKNYPDKATYDINITESGVMPYINHAPERVQYHGKIGCVTVPNHTIIVRRNGKPIISGNSFESMYQAIRRCWRFGQIKPVDVYIVISEGEGAVRQNIERKQADAERMMGEIVKYTKDILTGDLRGVKRERSEYIATEKVIIPQWLKEEAM